MTIKPYIYPISIVLLFIFYGVGIWGMLGDDRMEFAELTPLNLLITSALLILNLSGIEARYWLFPAIAFLTGYGVEVLGVHTGFPFGNYAYGEALGPNLFEVPLMIGVNWALLVYCASTITGKMRTGIPGKAFFSALLMTGLDALMEPMAMKLGFWDWQGHEVPAKNYVAWFIISYFLSWVFFRMHNDHKNKLGPWVFGVQLVFFLILNTQL